MRVTSAAVCSIIVFGAILHAENDLSLPPSFDLIFRANQVNHMALSPDGQKVAYDYRKEGVLLIGIYNFMSDENRFLKLWEDDNKNSKNKKAKDSKIVTDLNWLSSERLMVSVDQTVILAVNSDGGKFTTLMKMRTFREKLSEQELRKAFIEDLIDENDTYFDDEDTDERILERVRKRANVNAN